MKKNDKSKDSKPDLQRRLVALELVAYWEGRLITNQLMKWFGISRQQASIDIKTYLEHHNPGGLVYSPAAKGYIPTPTFKPVLTTGHINEYMTCLAAHERVAGDAVVEDYPLVSSVQLPDRSVRPEVVREIMRACRAGTSIKILYASMANPTLRERVISPHTMIYTGFRWHVRAWCHSREQFRDFILSRIDRAPKSTTDVGPGIEADALWSERITVALIANEHLSSEQRALVERDYGMPDGRLQISARKALIHYTLHRFQAAITDEQSSQPFAYPLQLLPADRDRIAAYLFGREAE